MGAKKLLVVAGGALLFAQQSGLLDELMSPPEDPEDVDEDIDLTDPYNRNPMGDLASNLLTGLGLHAAGSILERSVKKKAVLDGKKAPPSADAKASVKPKVSAGVQPEPVKASVLTAPEKATSKAVVSAEKAGVKTATLATQGATVASKSAAKAAKGTQLLNKLKGTPADLIVMALSQILLAVLDLDPSAFKACESGEFDLGSLPDWANVMIGTVPFLGDLFDLIGNKLCLKGGCPNGTSDENGLCYKACDPGFKSDGATQCYKQYPEFEGNGMGHTITSITKKILMDTGRVPSSCDDSEDKVGLLCYEKAPTDWINVAGTIWQTCPNGFTDTGVRCENNMDVGAGRVPGLTPCQAGERDDGVSCWAKTGEVCGDDCSKGWDSCRRRGAFGECWGGCPLSCSSVEGIARTAFQRGQSAPNSWEERIDGLNYNKCPDGFSRIPGMPYLCTKSFTKESRVLGPRPMKCPMKPVSGVVVDGAQRERETDIAGLCYNEIPKGYSRKTLGLLDQDCPPGSQDFGVGCIRQAYNRGAGVLPLGIKFKDRI